MRSDLRRCEGIAQVELHVQQGRRQAPDSLLHFDGVFLGELPLSLPGVVLVLNVEGRRSIPLALLQHRAQLNHEVDHLQYVRPAGIRLPPVRGDLRDDAANLLIGLKPRLANDGHVIEQCGEDVGVENLAEGNQRLPDGGDCTRGGGLAVECGRADDGMQHVVDTKAAYRAAATADHAMLPVDVR